MAGSSVPLKGQIGKLKQNPPKKDLQAYQFPENHPLTPQSTIKDAIISLSPLRPKIITKGRGSDLPLITRYPYILYESWRLGSEVYQDFLSQPSVKKLHKDLAMVIEAMMPSSGSTWDWHDQFQPEAVYQESSKGERKVEVGKQTGKRLIDRFMEDKEVQELIAHPSVGFAIKEIFQRTAKVISLFCYDDIVTLIRVHLNLFLK